MRKPQRPPDVTGLLSAEDQPNVALVHAAHAQNDPNGKYLHWDRLRYHNPPGNLSHQQWWAATKCVRDWGRQYIGLLDTEGRRFSYVLPSRMQETLHHLTMQASGSLGAEAPPLRGAESRNRYLINSLIDEAITSSQIEGAVTTRRVAKEMIRSQRKPRDKSERMILNNYRAMQRIRRFAAKPLTPEMLLEMHEILTEGTLQDPSASGRFRRQDERVGVYDGRDNELMHQPPRAAELPDRFRKMVWFANGNPSVHFVHPAVRAIILHFWLAYDHPFVDGNGRCARALFYWSMLRSGYWLCEFLAISSIIAKAYSQYERAFLYTETDDNDLTYFVDYHLHVIRRAMDQLHTYLKRKAAAVEQTEKVLRSAGEFNHRQLALLSHALRHPDAVYTVKSQQTSHGVVYQTARSDLYGLVDKGLLDRTKRGRTFYFSPTRRLHDHGGR